MSRNLWSPLQKEVADELIQQRALGTSQGRACTKGCNQGCIDFCCSCVVAKTFSTLAWVSFIMSLIAVCILGALFVGPHFHSANYKPTQCQVVNVYHDEVISCSCGRYCESQTICVKVNVKYTREDGEEVQGMLHTTEDNDKCTDAPCSGDGTNAQRAESFAELYTPPHSFKCLYDPAEGSTKVIERRLFNNDAPVIHMLVWPLVVLVLAIAAAVFICRTCGCNYICSKNPPRDIMVTATNLHMAGIYTLKSLPVEERKRLVRECYPGPEEEVQAQQIQRGEIPQAV